MSQEKRADAGPGSEVAGQSLDLLSFELSSRRTGLSFQRTRPSADRTLMSVIRTSLSLIGFGFTIAQFFRYLRESTGVTQVVPIHAARNFGLALLLLGIAMLVPGIWGHVDFMRELRTERKRLVDERLVHGELAFPVSRTLIITVLLLMIGLTAFIGMLLRAGPFH